MRYNYSSLLKVLFIILLIPVVIVNCSSEKKKKQEKDQLKGDKELGLEDFITDDDIFDDIDKAKKIFYSLPSPLETAMLIKSAGAKYDEVLLNSLDNVRNYTTVKSLALNLGIYTTDLSFASLFDQTQTSINYMNAAKTLAEGLDIRDAIDNQTIKKLEDNLNNRDVVMDIISETFLNSSSYLKENDRSSVAAIVLVGGWVEGLYLATQLVGDKPIKDNKLADRVLEQKLSFNIVQRMLEDNRTNDEGETNVDVVELMVQLKDLKTAFDKVRVESSQIEVESDEKTNVSTLRAQTKIIATQETFNELKTVVNNLRTNFIQ